MNAILVPTLAELRTELEQAEAKRAQAYLATQANPSAAADAAWEAALDYCWLVMDQIAALPAASINDLRVKAYAVSWSSMLMDGEPFENPSPAETKLFTQLVAGLLDAGIAG